MKLFDSWGRAIQAAGLDSAGIVQWAQRFRTKADILRAIRRRKRARLPLQSTKVQKGPERDYGLHKASERLFGGWQKAVEAAGVDYSKIL